MIEREGLVDSLERCLRVAGVDPKPLLSESTEIVFFGSRAVGLERSESDLDVLCISPEKKRLRTSQLDLIVYPREEMYSVYWRSCELAAHISNYGLWIKGEGEWRSGVRLGRAAILRKQRRLGSLVRNAHLAWGEFHPLFQEKYATAIRRDLQRLCLLEHGTAVPPTPVLDQEWAAGEVDHEILAGYVSDLPNVSSLEIGWARARLCSDANDASSCKLA